MSCIVVCFVWTLLPGKIRLWFHEWRIFFLLDVPEKDLNFYKTRTDTHQWFSQPFSNFGNLQIVWKAFKALSRNPFLSSLFITSRWETTKLEILFISCLWYVKNRIFHTIAIKTLKVSDLFIVVVVYVRRLLWMLCFKALFLSFHHWLARKNREKRRIGDSDS